MTIKDEFHEYWENGQPYNQEYAVVDDSELDRLVGESNRSVENRDSMQLKK